MSRPVGFSWETPEARAAEQALVVRKRDLDQVVKTFRQKKKDEQKLIDKIQEELNEGQQVVLRERSDNRLETNRLRSDELEVKHKLERLQQEREEVERQGRELEAREEESKRNRTMSMIFVEDNFAQLTPKGVVDYLTHASPRIREHAMNNIAYCISKSIEAKPSFVKFGASEIAPFLLPKIDQLISTKKLNDSVREFSELVVSNREMARALAMSGQCPNLAAYLIRNNEAVSRFAIVALQKMMDTDPQVLSVVYVALKEVVPYTPISDLPSAPCHPSVTFLAEISPRIVTDCFSNGLWSTVAPLVVHKSDVIRRAVLPKIISEATSSDRVQDGLLEVDILRLLDHHYESPHPPIDAVDFFVGLLPLLAQKMCRKLDHVLWLLLRLKDPSERIAAAVISAFRAAATTEDPAILDIFVTAELLQRLSDTPIQSAAITGLIYHILPILAIPHATAKTSSRIIKFLDHPDTALGEASLNACIKIVDSTVAIRDDLYSEFTKLDFTKQSTLKLCDYAMPIFCKDRIIASDYSTVCKYVFHPELRMRRPAQRVWREVVSGTPLARSAIVRDGLLGSVFDLCCSYHEDCVQLGSDLLPHSAADIGKAGLDFTRQLVALLDHYRPNLRNAALQCVHIISESGETGCEVLLAAGAFNTLRYSLHKYPLDNAQTAQQIFIQLAPFLAKSKDDCYGLLQFIDSKVPELESAARVALDKISQTTINHREVLRDAIMEGLQLASDNLVKFSAQAIQEWIGPDLVQLNKLEQLFHLASHHDRRIQDVALLSLKKKLDNREYQNSLEKAAIVPLIRSLSESDNPEAIDFVASVLRLLALTLASHGHVGDIFHHLTHREPSIQAGASAAIVAIANSSEVDRQLLLDENVLERLTGRFERLGSTELGLTGMIIPPLTPGYFRADRAKFILALIDHPQELISKAAIKSVVNFAGGSDADRKKLQDALLPTLGGGSIALHDVASKCLEKTLSRDLIADGNYRQLFCLLENEHTSIRAVVIAKLQYHIQSSGAAARQGLVDAGILDASLQAAKTDDMILFISDCILPILGPFFTQNDGGASVISLLRHDDPRLLAAAANAIRHGVESHYGNLNNIANAMIISHLHPTIEDDTIRDLWCYVVPKVAPYLSNQKEINLLVSSLSDPHPLLRHASSEAISVMAKTSNETRLHLLPTLISHLDGPPDAAIEQISHAVSLSGFAFLSTGNGSILLDIIGSVVPGLVDAAVQAVTDILTHGRESDHRKLMEANVYEVVFRFYKNGSHPRLALPLLQNVIKCLGCKIVLNEQYTEQLLYLFDDSDQNLSQTLYLSLVDVVCNSQTSVHANVLQLLPMLIDANRQRMPFVSKLLLQIAPHVTPQLFDLRRFRVIVQLLSVEDETVTRAYIREVQERLIEATSLEKDLLAGDARLVPAIGHFLRSKDVTIRRISAHAVELLSQNSPSRSAAMMEAGIGSSLAWISQYGGNDVPASLDALTSLYQTAPDHGDQLVEDCLPALRHILSGPDSSTEVYANALTLLRHITKNSPHRLIINSGIVGCLIEWLKPQHTILDLRCRESTFEICQLIAQNSDPGRRVLIDGRIVPVLVQLSADTSASNVVNACNVLNALAHTGTYRSELVWVQDAMERITSPFKKSTLQSRSDKHEAHKAAKAVLSTLESTRRIPQRSTTTTAPLTPSMNRPAIKPYFGSGSNTVHIEEVPRSHVRDSVFEPEVANSYVPSPTSNEVFREPINMVNEQMPTATNLGNPPMTPTPDAFPIPPSARPSLNTLGIPRSPLNTGQVEERPLNPFMRYSSTPSFYASYHRGGYDIGEHGQMPSTSGDWGTHNGNQNSSTPITNSGIFGVNDEPRSIINDEPRSVASDELQSQAPPSYRTQPSLRRGFNRRVASSPTDHLSDVVEEQRSDTQQSDRSTIHFGTRKLRRNATTAGGSRGTNI